MKTAIDNLRSVNIATAIASGNDDYTNAVSLPACISTAITVGATNNSDAVADFSNSSAQVDLYAPGVSVLYASVPGGGYGYKSGTSMATPQVAGAIATMKSAWPRLDGRPGGGVARQQWTPGHRQQVGAAASPDQRAASHGTGNHHARQPRRARSSQPHPVRPPVRDLSPVNYWSAVAVRPPTGSDYDLAVYDNANLSGYLASSAAGGDQVDFVVQDNNRRAVNDWTYPLVHKYAGTGRYKIEYANTAVSLFDSTVTIATGSSSVVAIRDAYEVAGTPTYYRVVPTNGGQNPDLYLMQSTAGNAATYVQGRGSAVASSYGNGAGVAESFVHTSPVTQYNGLVLINRAGSGNYTLYRDSSAPTSSVTINNGDATTTSRNVTLSLPASDAQTGMMDMRISVDGVFDTEPWQNYASSGTATLPDGAGTKTVTVQFRNNAGMISTSSDTIDYVILTTPARPRSRARPRGSTR